MQNKEFSILDKGLAWFVHLFTASGIVFAFLAILAVANHRFMECLVWLIVCFFIDGVDGMMARKFKVKEVLPFMDGKHIDFVVDFTTYAIIPAYFMYEAFWMVDGVKMYFLPQVEWVRFGICSLVLLVSAIYYGKEPMVSEDMYFIGFPVLWNIVVFYLFVVVQFNPWVNVAWLVLFAILHFVPLKYAYPSQNKTLRNMALISVVVFFATNVWLMNIHPIRPLYLVIPSLLVVVYMFGFTLYVSLFKK
ncbi:MAG: CDP-alcohol phosphatidyltransferase family protein [Saprospiraceae bacterium]